MSTRDKWLVWMGVLWMGLFLWGCENTDDDLGQHNRQMILIEGYVYANEPIQHLRASRLHSGGSAQSLPIIDAHIQVFQGEMVFDLSPLDSLPGAYVQSDTAFMPEDHGALQLKVQYGGKTYYAHTQMPPPITGLTIDHDVLHLTASHEEDILAELSWNPVGNGPYCIFIRNRSESAIETGYGSTHAEENPFISLVHTHQVALRSAHFAHLGTYDLYVTVANPEYADLYVGNPTGGFVSAPSNISDGYGVFTAFNGMAVTVHVQ